MTEETQPPIWLDVTNEDEARDFWGIDEKAGSLRRDSCGGGYPPKFPLPILVWLRVFQDATFHIPAEKVVAALAYQTDLMQQEQRQRLIFSGISRNAKDSIKFKFCEILNTDARKLIPFKRSWTVDFQDVRKPPQVLDGRPSQISPGHLKLVEAALYDLAGYKKKKLWKWTPEDQLNNRRPSLYCTNYRADRLTELVFENIGRIRRPPISQGVKHPAKSVVRKALSELVSFQPPSISLEVNSDT